MKELKIYLEELFATPLTTIGIGNCAAPPMDGAEIGSGDLLYYFKSRKRRKRRKRSISRLKRT